MTKDINLSSVNGCSLINIVIIFLFVSCFVNFGLFSVPERHLESWITYRMYLRVGEPLRHVLVVNGKNIMHETVHWFVP